MFIRKRGDLRFMPIAFASSCLRVADYHTMRCADPESSIASKKKPSMTDAKNDLVRHVIDSRQYTELATNPSFSLRDFNAAPEK
jgi:hypothetical protein